MNEIRYLVCWKDANGDLYTESCSTYKYASKFFYHTCRDTSNSEVMFCEVTPYCEIRKIISTEINREKGGSDDGN